MLEELIERIRKRGFTIHIGIYGNEHAEKLTEHRMLKPGELYTCEIIKRWEDDEELRIDFTGDNILETLERAEKHLNKIAELFK